jgi:hypothetical protein
MADLIHPPVAGSRVEWSLVDSDSRFRSPFTSTSVTSGRRGEPWEVAITYPPVVDDRRGQMLAFLAALRGGKNRVWVPDFGYRALGTFPAPETATNPYPVFSVAEYTPSGEVTVLADLAAGLRITRTGVVSNATVSALLTGLASAGAYAARVLILAGRGPVNCRVDIGATAGSTGWASQTFTAGGLVTVPFIAAATTGYLTITDLPSGKSAGHFTHFPFVSVSRCLRVDGAQNPGGLLLVRDGVPNRPTALRASDLVNVGGQLVRLVADLSIDGTGRGAMLFAPDLRKPIADLAPVVTRTPLLRTHLSGNRRSWSNRPGRFSDISLTLEEDIT